MIEHRRDIIDILPLEIEELVEKKFDGSIPSFLATFTKSQQLTDSEIQELQQMIDRFRRERLDD